jgi:hypothetical protein
MYRRFRLAVVALALVMGCNTDGHEPSEVSGGLSGLRSEEGPDLTVMSRNMYIGANVDAVIAALASPDPGDDFPALLGAIGTLEETDFSSRVKALADEIGRYRPHAVGLQEVTSLDIDLTGFGIPVSLHQDFLPALLTELESRGLHYVTAAKVTNVQAAPIPGISLVDHDALLVDPARVTLGNLKIEQNFSTNIGVVAPGVEIKRGFVAVDAIIDGQGYVFVNTHLESGSAPGLDQLRAAQAVELATVLGNASRVVVLGDFNDVPRSQMYQVMEGAGFTDLWAALQPDERGFTCCHLPNLANERQTFDQRIDFIFGRGLGRGADQPRGLLTRTGESIRNRIAGPVHSIWPSDHAGLVGKLFTGGRNPSQ